MEEVGMTVDPRGAIAGIRAMPASNPATAIVRVAAFVWVHVP